ncbi:MAG: hypothetical protein ACLPWS_09585 [Rhodomicrobium sp.]
MNAKAMIGAALIVIAASLAGGGVYAVHILKQKKFDPETLCPLQGSQAVTLIIIDKTDPLTAPEQARIRGAAAAERDTVQRGDRIAVKLLQQKPGMAETVLETVAELCNPGAEANPLFENPKRVAARYRNAFREPIEEALASLPAAGSAPSSPIARAIGDSIEAAPPSPGQHLRLILISDLMEHTDEASAYAGTLSEAALHKAMPRPALERMKGAEVRVMLLARPRYAKQQGAALAIWRRFLRAVTEREPDIVRP